MTNSVRIATHAYIWCVLTPSAVRMLPTLNR